MLHTQPRLALLALTCALTLPGCDRVEALFSDAEPETASEAKPAKADPDARQPTPAAALANADPAATPAKVAAAIADPAAATPAKVAPAKANPNDPPDATPQPVATTPTPRCIVGHWDAIEYTEAVRRAIAKDPQLRKMKKTSSGGHITYVVAAPTDETGVVTATADALSYRFAGKVQGMRVGLGVKINGETEAAYRLEGDDRIVVDKPTRNTMKVKANVTVKGLGSTGRRSTMDLDFDGAFTYDCSAESLTIWRGDRTGRPMVFERGADS